jgi:signal peptidase II
MNCGVRRRVNPMRKISRLVLVATLMVGCVGCDQVSKGMARAQLSLGANHSYLDDTFRIIHVENPGAFLGMGANLPATIRAAVFQGAISLVVLALLWMAAFRRDIRPWQVVGLTLLAASGVGNLIDRFLNDGRVTDFLNLGVGTLRTGIFNFADVFGMLGFVVLLFAIGAVTPPNKTLERTPEG